MKHHRTPKLAPSRTRGSSSAGSAACLAGMAVLLVAVKSADNWGSALAKQGLKQIDNLVKPASGWVKPASGWVKPASGWVKPASGWVKPAGEGLADALQPGGQASKIGGRDIVANSLGSAPSRHALSEAADDAFVVQLERIGGSLPQSTEFDPLKADSFGLREYAVILPGDRTTNRAIFGEGEAWNGRREKYYGDLSMALSDQARLKTRAHTLFSSNDGRERLKDLVQSIPRPVVVGHSVGKGANRRFRLPGGESVTRQELLSWNPETKILTCFGGDFGVEGKIWLSDAVRAAQFAENMAFMQLGAPGHSYDELMALALRLAILEREAGYIVKPVKIGVAGLGVAVVGNQLEGHGDRD